MCPYTPPPAVVESVKGVTLDHNFYQALKNLLPEYDNFTPLALFVAGTSVEHYFLSKIDVSGDTGFNHVAANEAGKGACKSLKTAATAGYDIYCVHRASIEPYNSLNTPLWPANPFFVGASLVVLKTMIKLPDITNIRVLLGIPSGDSDLDVLNVNITWHCYWFKYFSDTETTWKACYNDATADTITETDTGITVDSDWHVLKVEVSTSSAKFHIDDSMVAEIAKPDYDWDMVSSATYTVHTLEALVKELRIAYSIYGLVF